MRRDSAAVLNVALSLSFSQAFFWENLRSQYEGGIRPTQLTY
jgi:hypothetical protein